MKNYCVYLHIKLDSGEPFYVGKGKNRREVSKYGRNKWWYNIVNKHKFDIIILEENLSFVQANQLEIYWISRIGRKDLGRGPLINLTDGGEGTLGNKREIGKNKGRSNPFYGKKHSEKTKSKIRTSNSNRQYTKERENKRIKNTYINTIYGKVWPKSRLVLNIETGIYYNSIREASLSYEISEDLLRAKLSGRHKNNTQLRFI